MKKAQLKIGETIAVLIVFFVLLFFGIMFYSNLERENIKEQVEDIEQQASIDIAQRIQFLPELKCTSGDITRTLCIDKIKMRAFKNISSQSMTYYQSVFGSSKIEVAEIYPEFSNYTLLYQGPESQQYFTTFLPISIFEPLPYPGKYKVGMLKVTYYMFSQ